jgi:hypothetical protein
MRLPAKAPTRPAAPPAPELEPWLCLPPPRSEPAMPISPLDCLFFPPPPKSWFMASCYLTISPRDSIRRHLGRATYSESSVALSTSLAILDWLRIRFLPPKSWRGSANGWSCFCGYIPLRLSGAELDKIVFARDIVPLRNPTCGESRRLVGGAFLRRSARI